jgi:hypothetical protein
MPQIIDLVLTLPRHPERTYQPRDVGQLRYVVVHHTAGTDNPRTPEIEPEVIPPEVLARYHISRGWSGIGYHYLVYRDGTIYKVRPIGVVGACVKGHNTPSICIAFVGNYSMSPPSVMARASCLWLISLLRQHYPHLRELRGHREMAGQSTQCPGEAFDMDQFRAEAGWTA